MCFSVLAVAALSSCQILNNTLEFQKHYKCVMSALIPHKIILYPNKSSIYIWLFVFLCYLSAQRVNIGRSVFIAVKSRERQSLSRAAVPLHIMVSQVPSVSPSDRQLFPVPANPAWMSLSKLSIMLNCVNLYVLCNFPF